MPYKIYIEWKIVLLKYFRPSRVMMKLKHVKVSFAHQLECPLLSLKLQC